MNPFSIPPIISSILFLFWGIFIYSQNRKSNIHSTFLFLCLTTFWWQFSWFFLFNIQDENLANILVRIGHIGILLLPVAFLHFILAFLGKLNKFNKIILYFCYFITLLFEISLFSTDYLIAGFYRYFWGFYPKAGPLHPFFLLFVTLVEIRFVSLLLFSLKRELKRSRRRSQIEYVLIGMILYTFAASDFAVNYGYEFYPIGFIAILLFLGAIGYAIAKYRLMNIKVILTEILVGIIASTLLAQFLTAKAFFDYLWKGALFLIFLLFGYFLIRSVLSEIKRREELQKLYEQVAKLSKSKSEFISIASHQLRTPLAAIKGYISMILEGSYGAISEKTKKPMENVYQSNERLIKLVNDLLSVSRIESGKLDLELKKASLEETISSAVDELKIKAKEKNLDLNWEKPAPPLPEVLIDENKLRQVFLNIIDNAIKYTNAGGITIKSAVGKSALRITIADTGEGMTQEEIANLFESFSRGGTGTRLYAEGAGLGLYIAKKFVEMHSGRIWVESLGKGQGSTFYIELPIK